MKQADVKVGETYWTKIGEQLAKVVVVGTRVDLKGRTRFTVRRLSEGRYLPKSRTAAALRPL